MLPGYQYKNHCKTDGMPSTGACTAKARPVQSLTQNCEPCFQTKINISIPKKSTYFITWFSLAVRLSIPTNHRYSMYRIIPTHDTMGCTNIPVYITHNGPLMDQCIPLTPSGTLRYDEPCFTTQNPTHLFTRLAHQLVMHIMSCMCYEIKFSG